MPLLAAHQVPVAFGRRFVLEVSVHIDRSPNELLNMIFQFRYRYSSHPDQLFKFSSISSGFCPTAKIHNQEIVLVRARPILVSFLFL